MSGFAKRLWRAALAGLAAGLMGLGAAHAAILHHWVDTTGRADLAQVQGLPAQAWQAYDGLKGLGYTDRAMWVRLQIQEGDAWVPQVLRVRPAYLDEIDVWVPLKDGGYERFAQGDTRPHDARTLPDPAPNFQWAVVPGDVLYLRLASSSALLSHVQWLDLHAYVASTQSVQLVSGLFLGVMGLVLLWTLSLWREHHDGVYLLFATYVVCAIGLALGTLGWIGLWWTGSPALVNHFTSMVTLLTTASGGWFHRQFLFRRFGSLGLRRALDALLLATLLNGLNLLWSPGLAMRLNAWLVIVGVGMLALALFWRGLPAAADARRMFWVYLALVTLLVLSMAPLMLGWLPSPVFMYLSLVHALMTAAAVSLLLNQNVKAFRRRAREAEQQVLTLQLKHQISERNRQEQSAFLDMLTHEIRTLLSVVRMSLGVLRPPPEPAAQRSLQRSQQAVEGINQLIERVLQANRLEDPTPAAQGVTLDLVAFSRQLVQEMLPMQPLQVAWPAQAVPVRADPVWLRTLLGNLLDNALKYRVHDSAMQLQISALDAGGARWALGNAVAHDTVLDPALLYQKYYRGPGAHQKVGSGLGLYLVRMLCERTGVRLHMSRPRADWVVFELEFAP